MVRLFKHYVPHAVLWLGLADLCLLLLAAEGAWRLYAWQIGMGSDGVGSRLPQLLTFASCILTAMVAVGAYASDALQSKRFALARLLVAISLGVILLAVLRWLFPPITLWRLNTLYAMAFAFLFLLGARVLTGRLLGGEKFRRRVLVLGAGPRAKRLADLAGRPGASFAIVGHVAMNDGPVAVAHAVNRADIPNLAEHVRRAGASEVVLALEERRNSLPLSDLLRVKTAGVHVNDFSSFIERETGRVDLDSVNPSWLIFSDGFSSGRRLSSVAKRVFDVLVSAALLLLFAPVILVTAIAIRLESRGPAFFRQKRVGLYGEPFHLVKLRSMRTDAEANGKAVWAQHDDPRVTRVGRWIRKLRIDELPQAWAVLKGDMSFVGPRPERPQFVVDLESRLPFYAERHMVKPGITGWAQVNYPYGASIEDARHKLEYDLYYAKNYTPFLDILILLQTVRVVLWSDGAR